MPQRKINFIKKDSTIDVRITTDKNLDELSVLLISDVHLDNTKSRRDLLKKHLKEVESKNGIVISGGDLMDLMQGKLDRRSSKSSLMDIHKIAYIDDVIDDCSETLSQYDLSYILLDGNHETSVLNKLEKLED
jgi:UDP-2,3-diacylglucosamine pyrophosphatase LpxH